LPTIQKTDDGGYMIFGNDDDYDHMFYSTFIEKLDSMGNVLWGEQIQDNNLTQSAIGGQQTSDGGYIITGGPALVKTDSLGNLLWNYGYDGTGNDIVNSVQQTMDKGFIIGGYTTSFGAGEYDIWLIKTDSVGTLQWSKTYGGSKNDYSYSVKQTNDGGYIIAGNTYSFSDTVNGDAYLIKTDGNGNMQWSKTYGGFGIDKAKSVQQTTNGGYIINGSTNSFGSSSRIYLIKTDAYGNSDCNQNNPATIVTASNPISSSDIYLSSFPLVRSESVVNTASNHGGIDSTICLTQTGIKEISTSSSLLLSPNPFTTTTTLTLQGTCHNPSLFIYNLLGQEVRSIPIGTNTQLTINREHLASGMYFYKVIDENKEVLGIGKMVIE